MVFRFETWDFMLNLNARTVFTASRAVIPHMLRQGSGRIANVAAHAALQGRQDGRLHRMQERHGTLDREHGGRT